YWRAGGKTVAMTASEFFLGPMVTALPPSACLIEVQFPVWSEPRLGVGFHEINARQSDFAFVSAAAQVALDSDGRCTRIAGGVGAAGAVPVRLAAVEPALRGTRCEGAAVREAVQGALRTIEPMADTHASADYRRRVAGTLAVRAIADAYRAAHAR